MARIIEWTMETGMVGGDRTGEVEVDDDASEDEIEEAVREDVLNFISWSWTEKQS